MLTRWSRLLPLALIGLFLAAPIHAAELANLTNGFSLRHDHHEVVGATTRLYMSADAAAGYIDIPTANIESFEPAPPDAARRCGRNPRSRRI